MPRSCACAPGAANAAARSSRATRLPRRALHALVVDPGELEIAARFGHGEELQVGVGRDSRREVRAEHLDSVVAAGEGVDDVALDEPPDVVVAEARLHRMLDQDADLDDLAALRLPWDLDPGGHSPSSRPDRRRG